MADNEGSEQLLLYLALVSVALLLLVAGAMSVLGSYSPGSYSFNIDINEKGQSIAEDRLGNSMGRIGGLGDSSSLNSGSSGSGGDGEGTGGGSGVGENRLETETQTGNSSNLTQEGNGETGNVGGNGSQDAGNQEGTQTEGEEEGGTDRNQTTGETQTEDEGGSTDNGTSGGQESSTETSSEESSQDDSSGGDENTGTEDSEGGDDGEGGNTGQDGNDGIGNQNTQETDGNSQDDEGGTSGAEDGEGDITPAGGLPVSSILRTLALVLVLLSTYVYRDRIPSVLKSPKKLASAVTKAAFDTVRFVESAVRRILDSESYREAASELYLLLASVVGSILGRDSEPEEIDSGVESDKDSASTTERKESTSRDLILEAWSLVLEASSYAHPETKTPAQVSSAAVGNGLPSGPVREITEAFRDVEYGNEDPDKKVSSIKNALSELGEKTSSQTDSPGEEE